MATDKAYALATIHGLEHSKEFHFLAGPKHPYLGLPADEIAGLGLSRLQNRRITFSTADGPIASDAYTARGTIQGMGFVATVLPLLYPSPDSNSWRTTGSWSTQKRIRWNWPPASYITCLPLST